MQGALSASSEQQIDRYLLKGVLGEGAMGRVYLAYDPKFNREVAVKIIRETMIDDERVRKWFHREARAIAQLQHPGIVEVHDYSGNEAHMPYLVMERLHGHTLKDVIEARGVCTPLVLCELAIQLGQALAHAHGQGLIHRDLKPDNLFVEPSGRIVITDFGLARAQMNVDLGASLASMGTAVVGTPLFLAPEAIHDPKSAGPQSDLYAVGVILYYCASLKMPFQADDPFQALSRILSGRHATIHTHRKDLPAAVCDAIERVFAFDAANRPQNGTELEALFTKVREAIAPGADSQQALISFLQKTDEFNSFTQATHIPASELVIPTPRAERTSTNITDETATNPDPMRISVEALTTSSEATVVGRAAGHTQIVTVPRTQVVTHKGASATQSQELPHKKRSLVWAIALVCVLIIAGITAVAVFMRPGAQKPAPVVVERPPAPKEDIMPATPPPLPMPDEKIDKINVPKERDPETPKPKEKPKVVSSEPGTLRVNTGEVWADIFINGEKRGQTPFKAKIELPPGKYRVKLVNPEYPTQELQVVITSGDVTPLKATLGKK